MLVHSQSMRLRERLQSYFILMTAILNLGFCFTAFAQTSLPSPSPTSSTAPISWQDEWWLEKLSSSLRGGAPLSTNETPAALLADGKEKAVDQFLADSRFTDTILGFALMWIGFRQDAVKDESGVYRAEFPDSVYQYPNALLATQQVDQSGDFFKIFDLTQKIYLAPLRRPYFPPLDDGKISDADLRSKVMDADQQDLSRLILLASQAHPDLDQICSGVDAHLNTYVDDDALQIKELPRAALRHPDYYGGVLNFCYSDRTQPYDLANAFRLIQSKNKILFSMIASFAPEVYQPKTPDQLKTLDLSTLLPNYRNTLYNPDPVQQTLRNSSTNYDRKRGAYVLSRFFCDNLTPVNVENPSAHAGANPHASNPSCFACHYKLDPMAGFFRYYGAQFKNYSTSDWIHFDDNAAAPVADYVKAWEMPANPAAPVATPTLNVGYIRSTQTTNINFYGSTLDDLHDFLKKAPEVRRCLVKRVYEYLVSDSQAVDGDYLDYLTTQFNQAEATSGSAVALKGVFKTVVLGNAYSTLHADKNQCYDRKPGYIPSAHELPCQVSSILRNSCVQCHSSTGGRGGLDLSHWQTFADGSSGFPHIDLNGAIVPPQTTLREILDRLNTTDPQSRMPYLSDMPSEDRQALDEWADQMQSPAGGQNP